MGQFKILLSAGASPAAYNIIGHLKALGHFVCAIDSNEKALPLAQEIADKVRQSPEATSEDYLPFIEGQIRRVDLFIPFIDEEIAALIRHADMGILEKCMLPEPETTRICLYKKEFQRFCLENDLPVAPSAKRSSVPRGAQAIFKPNLGRGGKGVEIIDSLSDFEEKSKADGVIQELIQGEEYTIDALFSRDGELIDISARRRDAASGVSTIGTVVDKAPFLPMVKKIGEALNFRFLINIQMIKDETNTLHIIEINPRIAGSVMFSIYSGLDFLKGAIDVYRGNQVSLPDRQRKIRIIRYWKEYVEDLSS